MVLAGRSAAVFFARLACAQHGIVVGDQCQVNCAVFADLVDLQSRIG